MKDSFILYNSFYDPIKTLKNEQLGKLFRSIFNYTINGEITQDNDILVAFMFIKNQIDLDAKKWQDIKQKRSEAGKKHKGNQYTTKWNKMEQNGTNGSVNENDNVNVNVNVNEKDIYKYIVEDNNVIKDVIDYLNLRTGQHYKHSTPKTKTLINARIKEGFALDDFKEVIDKMCIEWINTDMKKYLRPETLFGTKFESYLNREVKQTTKNITLSSEDISNIFN
jgi:uncharacterized phage protein (TIGR02220 family)